MKHIRTISASPVAAQTNFAALVDFMVGVVEQIVALVADNFQTGANVIFNKTGGSLR
jgi:hypothetical protein